MVQIIKEFREPSFSEKLGSGLAGAGQKLAEQLASRMQQKQQLNQMTTYADQLLEENPGNPQIANMANLLKSDLPFEMKTKLMQTMPERNPFAARQQARLEADQHINYYNTLIKELSEEKKNLSYLENKERGKVIDNEIKNLRTQRDQIAKSFGIVSDFEDDLENPEEDLEDTKIPFNPQNDTHTRKAQSLFDKYRNQGLSVQNAKKKTLKALEREFIFNE